MVDLHPGLRLLDRYELDRRLGAGGLSEVWLAADLGAGAPVALKFLSASLAGDEDGRGRFHAEWRAIRGLNHPHIVRIFEYHAEPRPFYAMQYVDGSDLTAFADRPPTEWLRAIACVGAALVYAHNRDIVHGDVTARNVLVDSTGRTVLSDFGLGSTPGAGGGTPAAVSPERRAGASPSPADDVYALGVLIFELWHGVAPGEEPRRWPPRDDFRVGPLQDLVERMLADAARRPDAEQVVDALGGLGISARALPAALSRERALRPAVIRAVDDDEAAVPTQRRPARTAGQASGPALPTRRGLSPNVVWAALAVLVLVAVWVVFFLPAEIDRSAERAAEVTAPAPAGADAAGDAGDEAALDGETIGFSENLAEDANRDELVQQKNRADRALGELLTKLEVLELRGVEQWGGEDYTAARQDYADGDKAYLAKNYPVAESRYLEATTRLDALIARVDLEFREALAAGQRALGAADVATAARQFELALAITPGNEEAELGLARASTLLEVIELTDQGADRERRGDYEAASERYQSALNLDPYYEPAADGLDRVREAVERARFESQMTVGFAALGEGRYRDARAAFETARRMRPGSREPSDGLLQVDQAERLETIDRLTAEAERQERAEQWQAAAGTYAEILKQDPNLALAKAGQSRARQRLALDRRLEAYIAEPDRLAEPATLASATKLLTDLVRMTDAGPRLTAQRKELSRLLKRAATPLAVEFRSDGQTEVTLFKVGRLGAFETRELELRPGTYTATGSRIGYRDVRVEFRVAPEIDIEPVVVRCEEPI